MDTVGLADTSGEVFPLFGDAFQVQGHGLFVCLSGGTADNGGDILDAGDMFELLEVLGHLLVPYLYPVFHDELQGYVTGFNGETEVHILSRGDMLAGEEHLGK